MDVSSSFWNCIHITSPQKQSLTKKLIRAEQNISVAKQIRIFVAPFTLFCFWANMDKFRLGIDFAFILC